MSVIEKPSNIIAITEYILAVIETDRSLKKAILIDDSPSCLFLAKKILIQSGWEVKTFCNPEEGYIFLSELENHFSYRYLIIDEHMPKMDGTKLIDSLIRKNSLYKKNIKILLTGETVNRKSNGKESFNKIIEKPITRKKIVHEILLFHILLLKRMLLKKGYHCLENF